MRANAGCMGEAGAGQLTKMVNQICIAGLVQALSEGLSFARAAGLDPLAVVEVISKGAAQSWQMENRHKTMLAGQFRSRLRGRMDAQGSGHLSATRRDGTERRLPVTSLVDQFYAEVEKMGGKRWDTSSLFARQEALQKGQVMDRSRISSGSEPARATFLSSWRSAQRAARRGARHSRRRDRWRELTLRAVARRAGVSHAAPYRHFPNHEALLVELAIEGFAELRDEIATARPMRRTPSPTASPISAPPICASSPAGRRWRA